MCLTLRALAQELVLGAPLWWSEALLYPTDALIQASVASGNSRGYESHLAISGRAEGCGGTTAGVAACQAGYAACCCVNFSQPTHLLYLRSHPCLMGLLWGSAERSCRELGASSGQARSTQGGCEYYSQPRRFLNS